MGILIGQDSRCQCSCADKCPLGKTGMEDRCTEFELLRAGLTTVPFVKPKAESKVSKWAAKMFWFCFGILAIFGYICMVVLTK